MMSKSKVTLLVAGALFGIAGVANAEEKLTVVSWGGAFTKSQVEAYHKPFIEKTGVELVSEDFSGGLAEIKAQVEAENVRWDLVSLDKPDIVRGCAEGLLETLILPFCQPVTTAPQPKMISFRARFTTAPSTPSWFRLSSQSMKTLLTARKHQPS